MDLQVIDPLSAVMILGGTLAATLLRCGWRDAGTALEVLAQLWQRPFDFNRVRAELGVQIQEIDRDGILRAQPREFGDGEFDEVTDTLIRRRSVHALFDRHEKFRSDRRRQSQTAASVFFQAAELAPVLGLAGTLIALSSLSGDASYGAAIGTAVTTTLYGLLLANFVFAPIAGAIGRRSEKEEKARQDLLDWLANSIRRGKGSEPEDERRKPRQAA